MDTFKVFSAPLEVFISITNLCNLSCKYCSVASSFTPLEGKDPLTGFTSKGGLSTEEWFALIDELETLKVFTVRLSGGEPFIHPDIYRIIERIANGPIRFSINTNAMNIGLEDAKRLKGYEARIDDIMVSLDGSKAKVHDKLRGDGSFKRSLRGIEALLKEGLPVSIYTTVVRYNYNDIPSVARFVNRLNVTGIKFNELIPMGNAVEHYAELSLTPDERRIVVDMVRGLKGEFNGFISGTYSDLLDMFSHMTDLPLAVYGMQTGDKVETSPPLLNVCSAGTTQITIRPDGWVTPCDRLYDFKVGNIRHKRLGAIWRDSRPLNRFRERFEMTIDDLPGCKDCGYKFRCTGGCPAIPYNLGEGLFCKDPLSCYRVFIGEEGFFVNGKN